MSVSITSSIAKVNSLGIAIKTVIADSETGECATLRITSRSNSARQWRYEFTDFNGDHYRLDTDEWIVQTDKICDGINPERIGDVAHVSSKVMSLGYHIPRSLNKSVA